MKWSGLRGSDPSARLATVSLQVQAEQFAQQERFIEPGESGVLTGTGYACRFDVFDVEMALTRSQSVVASARVRWLNQSIYHGSPRESFVALSPLAGSWSPDDSLIAVALRNPSLQGPHTEGMKDVDTYILDVGRSRLRRVGALTSYRPPDDDGASTARVHRR